MPGILDKLTSILGGASGAATGVGSIIDAIGPIIGLFSPDKQKEAAANAQQNVEKAAIQIQQMVQSGEIDADAALNMLSALEKQIATMSSDPDMQRGMSTANIIINNVKATLQTKRTSDLSASFLDPDWNRKKLTGTPEFQKERMGTGLRNYMMGTELGNEMKGTPYGNLADRAMAPSVNPMDRIGDVKSQVDKFFPPLDNSILKRPFKEKVY